MGNSWAARLIAAVAVLGALSLTAGGPGFAQSADDGPASRGKKRAGARWKPLFNGKDLKGWDVFLGEPSHHFRELSPDPKTVFTVVRVDGEPVLRVSGVIWGALTTKKAYSNYRLRAEYKWGDAIWPPLHFRDSGIMYHSVGKPRAVSGGANPRTGPGPLAVDQGQRGYFMESMEYQIARGDVGGYGSLGRVVVKEAARRPYFERPAGEWNVVEIEVFGDEARHYLNGKLVSRLQNARYVKGGKEAPLERGKIQIQSEGTEVFFRNIAVQSIEGLDPDPDGSAAYADPRTMPVEPLTREWHPLFNGRDLSGWSGYLGPEYDGFREARPDPSAVFTATQIDGEPALRANGIVWGSLMSDHAYENYHLRLEYRWGRHVWPPLNFRDSGLLYHGFGEPGLVSATADPLTGPGQLRHETGWGGYFMQSVECSISRGNTGIAGALGRVSFEVGAQTRREEKPAGQWNLVELKVLGDECLQLVNGELVTHVRNIRFHLDGKAHPLTRGKIQLESQGTEIYFRRIEIRRLDRLTE